jgi:2-isopropylmalate synthase
MTRLTILDTTLRDGDQAALFSAERKLAIAHALEDAGADIIETGFPCSSVSEAEVCARIARELSALTAVFCRARISDIRASARVFREGRGMLHISLPVSRINIGAKLGVSEARVIAMLREAVSYAKGLCLRVEAGAEDASRADRAFLAEYCEAARDAGADIVNIADTLGLFTPDSVRSLVSALVPIAPVSIHCHNDLGLATANTLAAVSAGAVQAEVSVSGLGERAGNASLEEVALHYGTGVYGTGVYSVPPTPPPPPPPPGPPAPAPPRSRHRRRSAAPPPRGRRYQPARRGRSPRLPPAPRPPRPPRACWPSRAPCRCGSGR